ncbi:MAG: DNA mismatch repair protein MutL [Alphaproteobacteria bacterium MarineAlpha3_Bin5]|nr:MAG: DNA mismatch repair protein MutL [Alphaproteobacteria bacterium MarineAlpha3_Bin5]
MRLRKLPESLINRIAAGEVVERPASVVKELIENAIDADASEIVISIRNAGQNFISVTDNGHGMAREELSLAIQRHATSKLISNDLGLIDTLGFRGEALPSIGAVSRLKLTSGLKDYKEAWQIEVEGGKILNTKLAALSNGTCVEVRDLFFATPARLKFLKSERTERSRIQDVINRLAMAYPRITFLLTDCGKKLIDLKVSTNSLPNCRLSRLAAIMGKDFEKNSLPIDAEREGYQMTGYAGLPTLNRRNAAMQFLFVNGRPVRDKLILGATRGAYRDVLAQNRYPILVLFIDTPQRMVDINVHPAKSEVRFRDEGIVRGLIVSGLRHALAEAGHRSSTTVSNLALGSMQPGYPQHSSHLPEKPFLSSVHDYQDNKDFAQQKTILGLNVPLQSNDVKYDETIEQSLQDYPLGVARAQLHCTYIVAQTIDGVVIIDQHAAHERLVQEKIKESMGKGGVPTQGLLIPEVVELKSNARDSLLSREKELKNFGLAIEAFGQGAILVRETPAILGELNISGLIHDLADDLSELGESIALEERIGDVCATMACHSSVRAGRPLKSEEMNSLLRQMEKTPFSGQCSHGRPTYIELKLADIEKLFGRR